MENRSLEHAAAAPAPSQEEPRSSDTKAPDALDEAAASTMRSLVGRLTPPFAQAAFQNLMYTFGLLRILGGVEGAKAVNRAGRGKIYLKPHQRAYDTSDYFLAWIEHGASSPATAASVARVQRMHDHYARTYAFSNETYVHGIALFTLLFDEFASLARSDVFTDAEKAAQVQHWRTIGELMRVHDLPTTWSGMQRALDQYEASTAWYRYTPEGHAAAQTVIAQFNQRWLPRWLHPLGRAALLSLQRDHVLLALGLKKPPLPMVWIIRTILRAAILLQLQFVARRSPQSEI